MDARFTEYGNLAVTLAGGEVIIDTDQRGRLTVRAQEGTLAVMPISSNWVSIAVDPTWDHGPDPKLQAAKDRVREFLRQRSVMSTLDQTEIGGVHSDVTKDPASLLVDDLKRLAGE